MKSRQNLVGLTLVLFLAACNLPSQASPTENNDAQVDLLPDSAFATEVPESIVLNVDDYGANPFDDQPDSRAIQSALKDLKSGQTLQFTSGGGNEGYVGYLINETLYIVWGNENHDIILTSSDSDDPALLQATDDLLGFVIRLFSRARDHNPGLMDNITLKHLIIDAGREARVCAGPDGVPNGIDDNWGSWIDGECPAEDDSWCNAGGISLTGSVDFPDYGQDYKSNPSRWTTGLWVDDVLIRNVECGTAVGLSGAESGVINSTIDTAGEHTHSTGCAATDPDGELAFWSDGITFDGTNMLVENNKIINASDVAIVFFGGKDTRIINNTITSTDGNYGAFAAIQIGTVGFSDISGMEIVGNTVISTSDQNCGGLHTGINLGQIMWNKGCVGEAGYGTIGNAGTCTDTPVPPEGGHCVVGELCQIWAYVPPEGTISLTDNLVRGAHINYLVQGIEVLGTFEINGNISEAPQESDWEAASYGCGGQPWGPIDFVAWNPAIDGWTERAILCER